MNPNHPPACAAPASLSGPPGSRPDSTADRDEQGLFAAQVMDLVAGWPALPCTMMLLLVQYMSGLPFVALPKWLRAEGTRMHANATALALLPLACGSAVLADCPVTAAALAIATVSAMRWAQLVTIHIAAHRRTAANGFQTVGTVLSAILLIEPFGGPTPLPGYATDHVDSHHEKSRLSTPEDPTYRFLVRHMGFRPGDPVERSFRRYLWALVNPGLHLRLIGKRLAANLRAGGMVRTMSLAQLMLWLGFIAAGLGEPLLVAWILPLTVGFNLAQMIRLPVEHRFRPRDEATLSPLALKRALTPVNHMIGRLPAAGAGVGTWAIYGACQLFNLAIRFVAFPRDSAAGHAKHHERAGDVGNYEAEARADRLRAISRGEPLNPLSWGYLDALGGFFRSVAAARSFETKEARHDA